MAIDPFSLVIGGFSLLSGFQQKSASNKAAERAQEAANFNANLIERDIGLLDKQRGIINANFLVQQQRAKDAFERDVQAAARSGFAYAGFDISVDTPMEVLRDNAREFDYEQSVARFNNMVTNMQITDEQESATLNAELARMEGVSQASGLRAAGTRSLISGLGEAARFTYQAGTFTA